MQAARQRPQGVDERGLHRVTELIDERERADEDARHGADTTFLGPAEVIDVSGGPPRCRLPSGAAVSAELALAVPYAPEPGDVLLVIGKGGRHYVIGVLSGKGRTALSFQGDVEVEATGTLTLSGGAGVRVRGPEIDLVAAKIGTVAETVVQTLGSLWQRVTSLLSVHAGEAHTVVDDASYTQAKRAAILTEETVTINGKEVHLG